MKDSKLNGRLIPNG